MATTLPRGEEELSLRRDLPLMMALMALSWWLAWKFRDPFISDWDGFDYTVSIVRGQPSVLGLGRALFLGINHLLWRLLHRWQLLSHEEAYLLPRYVAITLAGPAVAGLYAVCRELAVSRLAAVIGALLLALSPFYILYSGRSMSEIPGLFALNWSLWLLVRSLRRGSAAGYLLAALCLGLAANIREFAVFYFPFIVIAGWLWRFRWRVILAGSIAAGTTAISGMLFWYLRRGDLYLDAVRLWYRLSAEERRLNPVTWKNLTFFGDYAYQCSVAVVFLTPLALAWLWGRPERRPLLWLGLIGLLANLALIANHDLSLNPRYLLMGMSGLAPVCGWVVAELFAGGRWRGLALSGGIAALMIAGFIAFAPEIFYQERNSRAAREYLRRVAPLPWNSGLIVGTRSPLINFYAGIEARPFWKTISPGSGWPDERLEETIDDLIIGGRVVYVDFDPEIWQSGARTRSREAAGLEMIRHTYELQPVEGGLYRIISKLTD